MPWTNRLRESSGLRILSLPPRGVSLLATAYDSTFFPSLSQLPATCPFMIDASTRFNYFSPLLMLRQSGAGQVAQILPGYCGETKANWDWGDVAWQERQRRISLLRSVRGEMPNNSIVFTCNFFYNNFAISRLLIGGGLSSVRIRTMEMTWWWHNLYSSASYVRLSEKL